MEICGEYLMQHTDRDLFSYFRVHYRHFFPCLRDRTRFARQAADLWQIKAAIQRWLVEISGQTLDPLQSIDTLPLLVCTYTRAPRDRYFPLVADYSHCAAKKLDHYGFKLGLRISRRGMITHYPLLVARPHDINHLDAPVEGFSGIAPTDKGFIDVYRQAQLAERHAVKVVTPQRSNMESGVTSPASDQSSAY
jgi:Transposase DDE domain